MTDYDTNIRRLPVYMLIDCSSSMNGEAIAAVDQGFKNLIYRLITEPHTTDIVWLSIIFFDTVPRQLIPLCPLQNIRSLPLHLSGSTNLGKAFTFTRQCMDKEVRKQTVERRGDWKPIVFLMTDGYPTDEWKASHFALSQESNIIACGFGSRVHTAFLQEITEMVVLMKEITRESLNQFIDFIGSTLTTASQRSDSKSDKIVLEKKYDKIVIT